MASFESEAPTDFAPPDYLPPRARITPAERAASAAREGSPPRPRAPKPPWRNPNWKGPNLGRGGLDPPDKRKLPAGQSVAAQIMQRRHSHNMSPADGRCMYATPKGEVWYGAARSAPPRCISPPHPQTVVTEMAIAVVAGQKVVAPGRRREDGWVGVESEAAARRRAELGAELGAEPSASLPSRAQQVLSRQEELGGSCGSLSRRAASAPSLSPREISLSPREEMAPRITRASRAPRSQSPPQSPRILCSSLSPREISPLISCSSLSPRHHSGGSAGSSFVYEASPDAGYSPYSPVPPWTGAWPTERSPVHSSSYSPYAPYPAAAHGRTPRSQVTITYPSPAMHAATEAWSAVASPGARAAAAGAAMQGLGGACDAGQDEVRATLAEKSLAQALIQSLALTPTPAPQPSPNPNPSPNPSPNPDPDPNPNSNPNPDPEP